MMIGRNGSQLANFHRIADQLPLHRALYSVGTSGSWKIQAADQCRCTKGRATAPPLPQLLVARCVSANAIQGQQVWASWCASSDILERCTLPWGERRERAHAKALELTLQHFDLLTLGLDDTFQPAVGTNEESECADGTSEESECADGTSEESECADGVER